jgi:hypothetical protein
LCVAASAADTVSKAADVSLQGWAQQGEERGEPDTAAGAAAAASVGAAGKYHDCGTSFEMLGVDQCVANRAQVLLSVAYIEFPCMCSSPCTDVAQHTICTSD